MRGYYIGNVQNSTRGNKMDKLIDIQNITFSYNNTGRKILSECSLSVESGDLVSILGPNGAGKSTLLNCACGLLSPNSGEIFLNGKSIKKMVQKDIARVIGYVQQTQNPVFDHNVFDYVLMGRASNIGLFQKPTKADYDIVTKILDQMNMSYLAEKAVTEISGGERQQAAIARAVAQEPKIIFFDEPTAHLDYGNQINTLRLIASLREKGFAIIMTTHNPDHCMMLGGKVAILNKEGRLITGACSDILTEDLLMDVYKTELCLTYVNEVNRIACIPKGM